MEDGARPREEGRGGEEGKARKNPKFAMEQARYVDTSSKLAQRSQLSTCPAHSHSPTLPLLLIAPYLSRVPKLTTCFQNGIWAILGGDKLVHQEKEKESG